MGEEGQVNENGSEELQQEITQLKTRLTEAENKEKAASNAAAGLQIQLGFAKDRVSELEQKEVRLIVEPQHDNWLNASQAEDKTRIVKLEADLKTAQASTPAAAQDTQAQSTDASAEATTDAPTDATSQVPVESSTDAAAAEKIAKLEEELAVARKEVEDLRTRAEAAEVSVAAADSDADTATKTDARPDTEQLEATKTQLEVTKAALDEREAKVAELEATLQQQQAVLDQREAKISNREAKAQDLREQANNKIRSIRQATDEEKARLTAEIEQLKKQLGSGGAPATPSTPKVSTAETPVKTEAVQWPDVNKDQIRAWINSNREAKEVLQMLINKYKVPLEKEVEALKKKIEELTKELEALKSTDRPSGAVDQNAADRHAADLAIAKAELEAENNLKVEQLEARWAKQSELKVKLTKGQLSALKVKWAVFEKAAKETPTEEVAKVYEVAKIAKDVAPTPSAPAAQPLPAGIPRPASALGQQPSAPAQTNGTPTAQANLPPGGLGIAGITAPNPFAQAARGTPAPGTAVQGQTTSAQQPQQQQAGRGHGTGPAALKGIMAGAGQTGIPRQTGIPQPGSGIPQPGSGIPQLGGRGAGRGGAAQGGIPRGGAAAAGRGGATGRGRGGAQSQNNSPRTSLNPGAGPFQPGQGAGRGQKRNADGEADGSGARGSKRPRGGRGGGGGAQGGQGGAAAE
jgi:nucleoprotein TPR